MSVYRRIPDIKRCRNPWQIFCFSKWKLNIYPILFNFQNLALMQDPDPWFVKDSDPAKLYGSDRIRKPGLMCVCCRLVVSVRNGPEEAWKQYSNTEVVEVSAAPPAYLHTYFSCNYRRVGTKIGLQRVKFHICVNYESKCL